MPAAALNVEDDLPVVNYAVTSASDGPFPVPFPLPTNYETALFVSIDGVQTANWTFTPDSAVAGGFPTGEVVLDDAVSNCSVSVWRALPLQRSVDYGNGPLDWAGLNAELAYMIMRLQDARVYATQNGLPTVAISAQLEDLLTQTSVQAFARLAGVSTISPVWYGADDTGAADASDELQDTIDYAETVKRAIAIAGIYLIGATSIAGDNFALVGNAAPEALDPYTDSGSELRITNTTNTPFKIGETVALAGLTVRYPNQVESTSAPISYPPLFENEDTTTTIAGLRLSNCTILGATTIADFGGTTTYDKAGLLEFNNVRAFCTQRYFNFVHVPDTVHFDSCNWGVHIYGDGVSHFGDAGSGGILGVSSITRSGTTATVTTVVAHGRATGEHVTIAGAPESEYNVVAAEITVLSTTTFTYQVAGSPATPSAGTTTKCHIFPLSDYHRDNAIWMRVAGNGTTLALSSYSVDGVFASNNVWLGFKSVFEIAGSGADGGFLQIVSLTGGAIDQTQHLLKLNPGGACYVFTACNITGYQERRSDPKWFGYLVDINTPAPAAGAQPSTEVNLADIEMGYMRGGLLNLSGNYIRRVSVKNFSCPAMCHTTENGDRFACIIDAPNVDVVLDMGRVAASAAATGSRIFCHIISARSVRISGVFDGWASVVKNESASCVVTVDARHINGSAAMVVGTYASKAIVAPTSYDTMVAALDALSAKGADIASATTTNLATATGPIVDVTGTGTITGLGTVAAGVRRTVRCTGACLFTHNATSLILPGNANYQAAANDTLEFESLGGGNWVCLWIKRQSGLVLASSLATAAQAKDATDTTHVLNPANLVDAAVQRLLFSLTADMNTTTDQSFTKNGTFTHFQLGSIRITRASISLTTAVGGIYSAASKGGDALLAASQVYSGATGPTLGFNLALTNLGLATRTETPILSLSTPQGAAATLNFRIYGFALPAADTP